MHIPAEDLRSIKEVAENEIEEENELELNLAPELEPRSGLGLAVGDVVTFSYEINARREVPVNPQIVRIRRDLEWEEVTANFAKERRFRNGISSSSFSFSFSCSLFLLLYTSA